MTRKRKNKIGWYGAGLFLIIAMLCAMYRTATGLFNESFSPVVYSLDKKILCASISPQEQWHLPLTAPLPQKYKICVINYEDKRYYLHPGIDPLAIGRAIISNIKARRVVSGGSTLTMQVARLAHGKNRRSFFQKAKEAWTALSLEFVYSKEEILTLYAAHAPFGGNIVGIESATRKYFDRLPNELSWGEAALLAVLPNAPSMMHLKRNREQLLQKRNRLLQLLRNKDKITDQEYQLAQLEPLPTGVIDFPLHALHLLGKQQHTSLDYDLQVRCEEIADRYAHSYADNYIYNLAIVVAEVSSGRCMAYVGNAPYLKQNHQGYVDVASARRSSGSVLKPILYAGMLHASQLLPQMLVQDTPIDIKGFRPENYDKQYRGMVPAEEAIRSSLNVPLVRMVNQYGIGRFKALLKELGITTMPYSDSHYGSTIVLGGAECTLTELVGVYASMARMLNRYNSHQQYDHGDTHPLYIKTPHTPPSTQPNETPILDASALWYMAECMSGVNRPEEESTWQLYAASSKIAWKTGTSYGGRDAWSIGFTPEYAVGVWVGNADGKSRAGLTGVGYAAPVMFEVFSGLPTSSWFTAPYNEMSQEVICRQSGHLAGIHCPNTDTLYVPQKGKQTPVCPYHKTIRTTHDKSLKTLFILPPSAGRYYALTHLNEGTQPPISQQRQKIEIIFPGSNSEIVVPRGADGRYQKVVFSCAHTDPHATLFWHLNAQYIGSTEGEHNLGVDLTGGQQTLTVVDTSGYSKKVMFWVKR